MPIEASAPQYTHFCSATQNLAARNLFNGFSGLMAEYPATKLATLWTGYTVNWLSSYLATRSSDCTSHLAAKIFGYALIWLRSMNRQRSDLDRQSTAWLRSYRLRSYPATGYSVIWQHCQVAKQSTDCAVSTG